MWGYQVILKDPQTQNPTITKVYKKRKPITIAGGFSLDTNFMRKNYL